MTWTLLRLLSAAAPQSVCVSMDTSGPMDSKTPRCDAVNDISVKNNGIKV